MTKNKKRNRIKLLLTCNLQNKQLQVELYSLLYSTYTIKIQYYGNNEYWKNGKEVYPPNLSNVIKMNKINLRQLAENYLEE